MASQIILDFTVATDKVPGAGFDFTASADRSATTDGVIIDFDTTADYTQFAPFLVADQRHRLAILLGTPGVDITGLVDTVQTTEDTATLAKTATFSFIDPLAAFFVAGSRVRGDQAVVITATCIDGTGATAVQTMFTGTTRGVSDEDPYCPRATMTALSTSADLARRSDGCITIAAFADQTRGEIATAYLASMGFATDLSGVMTSVPRKPINLSGISGEALILRYCDVEGRYAREDGTGALEFLSEAEVLGAANRFELYESLYEGSPREDMPSQPTTVLSVGASIVSDVIPSAGNGLLGPGQTGLPNLTPVVTTVDESGVTDGKPWRKMTTTWRVLGTVTAERVEQWGMYTRKGITTGTETYMKTSQVDTTYNYKKTWVYFPDWSGALTLPCMMPTSQLLSTVVTTRGYSASPRDTSGALWTDGSYNQNDYELFGWISTVTTESVYAPSTDPRPCRLISTITTTMKSYAPISGNTYLYGDGSYRGSFAYYYLEFSRVEDRFFDNTLDVQAGKTGTQIVGTWHKEFGWKNIGLGPDGFPQEVYMLINETQPTKTGIPGWHTHTASDAPGPQAGSVPDPVASSDTVPQYSLVPALATVSAYVDLYGTTTRTDTNEDAENMDELYRVAKRKLRRELGVTETFSGPMIPLLKCWDVVGLWDSERNLGDSTTGLGRSGWVDKITRDFDLLNGWWGMTLTVIIPPEGV